MSQSVRSLTTLLAVLLLVFVAAPAQPGREGPVVVLSVDGIIGPATADFVVRGLSRAEQHGARLLVLQMDTPGGLDESMRRIIRAILASAVPVATFVAPAGARAASAGTYILYASHIAAMAPATNLGAATPVAIGGLPEPSSPDAPRDRATDSKDGKSVDGAPSTRPAPASRDAMREKAVNDAAAYLRALAQLRGRNAEFAEQAVLRATSLSAEDAARAGVIDVLARSLPELLQAIDGRRVTVPSGEVMLALGGATVETVEPDWRTRVLGLLSNPMLAMVLMMIGVYGLFIEFTSPGFGVPGVAGAIALLMALYAFQLLPVNWAGVALLALGAALMIAEVFLPTFGALGVGGIVAFVVGGLMLFDADDAGLQIGWPFVVALAVASAAGIAALGAFAVKARRRPVVSGREDMIGARAVVESVDGLEGWAQVHGERWRIVSRVPLLPGERVRVAEIRGLTLAVDRDSNDRR